MNRSPVSLWLLGVAGFCCLLLASCMLPPSEPAQVMLRPRAATAAATAGGGAPAAKAAGPQAGTPSPAGPLAVSIEEAVMMALENNHALLVQRLNPEIQRTFEEQERAVFDPVVDASLTASTSKADSRTGGDTRASAAAAGVGASQFLPTGTTVGAAVTTERDWGTGGPAQQATRAGLTVTQALLRGRGLGPNLASLRQARLDTLLSQYELRGFAEALLADVETTYWDYVLARRQIEIFDESLKLAGRQLEETQQRVRVGAIAEPEVAASEAEVALRQEGLIDAHSRAATLRVQLLRLIDPALLPAYEREVTPQTAPVIPSTALDALDSHLVLALRMRPDLNQALLLIQRGDLELVRTRNGLLPRMDLFISLGKTGYAKSFGGSIGNIGGDGFDASAGVIFQFPVGNRDAQARNQRAVLSRRQLQDSLHQFEDLVREDVESAYIEAERSRQQVDATAATRRLQEEKFRAETAKFRAGRSTSLLVAEVQRDLLASQVAEVEAVTNCLKARTSLYRLEGSLLERRGIAAPGREPVKARAWED